MARRITRLESALAGVFRVGVVSSVNREMCRARVAFRDKFVSAELPVLVQQSEAMRDYWLPAVDEQVACVFLPFAPEVGFVIGGFYSDQDAIPEGAEVEGERVIEADARLRLLVGDMEIQQTSEGVRIGGEEATQPFVRGTDHKALLSSLIDLLAQHTHPTGVGPSGPPANAASMSAKKGDIDGTLSEIITGR